MLKYVGAYYNNLVVQQKCGPSHYVYVVFKKKRYGWKTVNTTIYS